MSLLKELVKEMAASGSTSAGAVANVPGSLFGGGVVDAKKSRRKQFKMMRRISTFPSLKESLGVDLGKSDFDASDVISKLDAAEKKMKVDKDTTAFGMEDEEGNLVKVFVKTDQAEEFENTLAALLAGADEDDDDRNSAVEIAEILYQLKDKFEIVDVEWPTIEGDEEEEQEMEGEPAEGGEGEAEDPEMEADQQKPEGEDQAGAMDDELEGGLEGDMEGGDELGGGEEAAASALTQVIDAMKADSQAREAEAKAKEAEANAREAEASSKSAAHKVSQEEQVLDMEAYNSDKKDQDKESKTLAQLAKYKHDLAAEGQDYSSKTNDREPDRVNDEEEEDAELTKEELSKLIFRHLRSN